MNTHPAADLFPMMTRDELAEFAADIRKRGQLSPIVIWKGQIVDGRNRFQACALANVTPETIEHEFADDADAAQFVMSRNIHRRHLKPGQRAALIGKLREMFIEAAKGRQREGGTTGGKGRANLPRPSDGRRARDDMASAAGVSPRTMQHTLNAQDRGAPEVSEAMERGDLAPSTAARLVAAEPDHAAQAEAVAGGASRVREVIEERAVRRDRVVEFSPPEVARAALDGTPMVGNSWRKTALALAGAVLGEEQTAADGATP